MEPARAGIQGATELQHRVTRLFSVRISSCVIELGGLVTHMLVQKYYEVCYTSSQAVCVPAAVFFLGGDAYGGHRGWHQKRELCRKGT